MQSRTEYHAEIAAEVAELEARISRLRDISRKTLIEIETQFCRQLESLENQKAALQSSLRSIASLDESSFERIQLQLEAARADFHPSVTETF